MTREEAIKGLKVLAKDFSGYRPNEEMFNMAIEVLEQPEIIRCKDCKWGKEKCSITYQKYLICENSWSRPIRNVDDFCSRAERREG